MSVSTATIRKDVTFSLDEWQRIIAYAEEHFFSSELEAIRVLIGHGLHAKHHLASYKPKRSGQSMRKTLLFTVKQWRLIEEYHTSSGCSRLGLSIRKLIAEGLIDESERYHAA